MPEWSNGPVSKTGVAVMVTGGSNPPLSARSERHVTSSCTSGTCSVFSVLDCPVACSRRSWTGYAGWRHFARERRSRRDGTGPPSIQPTDAGRRRCARSVTAALPDGLLLLWAPAGMPAYRCCHAAGTGKHQERSWHKRGAYNALQTARQRSRARPGGKIRFRPTG